MPFIASFLGLLTYKYRSVFPQGFDLINLEAYFKI